jgi:hypothetical protein
MSAEQQPARRPDDEFWNLSKTLEELVAEQGVKPYDPESWPGVPEITDEEMDWWIAELRELRRGGTGKEPPA